MGFDWGGGTKADRPEPSDSWRDTLGWPWSGPGGGGLGLPYSSTARRSIGLGYHPDLADWRDYCLRPKHGLPPKVVNALNAIKARNADLHNARKSKSSRKPESSFKSSLLGNVNPPKAHDLRWTNSFTPVEDQGDIGSCTAQAVIGLIEYLMKEGGVPPNDMSRMFLYRVTRKLLGWSGDTGAYIRSTIKAMALFGTPPEHEWPYEVDLLEAEPDAYHYSFAQNFRAMTYARIDRGSDTSSTLDVLRRTLYDGFPVAFGFPVYESIADVAHNDDTVPFPTTNDRQLGGHAVLAVGYDDDRHDPRTGDKGAIVFRNSWGDAWAEAGYAYLPYRYVAEGLANDMWTIFNREWTDLNRFE